MTYKINLLREKPTNRDDYLNRLNIFTGWARFINEKTEKGKSADNKVIK